MTGTSRRIELAERPWAFDVLDLMRELDRSHPDKPFDNKMSSYEFVD